MPCKGAFLFIEIQRDIRNDVSAIAFYVLPQVGNLETNTCNCRKSYDSASLEVI